MEEAGRMSASEALGRGEPGPWMADTTSQGPSWPKSLCFCEKAGGLVYATPVETLLRLKRDLT